MSESNEKPASTLPAGASVYTRRSLSVYDFLVHFLSNRLIWRCSAKRLIEHSRKYLSANHLEIGIGSGKLFRKSAKGKKFDRLVIADVNQDCLDVAEGILVSFRPMKWHLDLLNPDFESDSCTGFQSIGLNYVLHCLPLSLPEKVELCRKLVDNCLVSGGVLFGSTIMQDLNPNWFSKRLMSFYNGKKIFNNEEDTIESFKEQIDNQDFEFELQTIGCVCLFGIRKC